MKSGGTVQKTAGEKGEPQRNMKFSCSKQCLGLAKDMGLVRK
jgi:hypothetical protein